MCCAGLVRGVLRNFGGGDRGLQSRVSGGVRWTAHFVVLGGGGWIVRFGCQKERRAADVSKQNALYTWCLAASKREETLARLHLLEGGGFVRVCSCALEGAGYLTDSSRTRRDTAFSNSKLVEKKFADIILFAIYFSLSIPVGLVYASAMSCNQPGFRACWWPLPLFLSALWRARALANIRIDSKVTVLLLRGFFSGPF